MLSAIPSQLYEGRRKEFTSLVSLLSLIPLLSLLFYSNPAQAQINRDGVLLARPLPPLPANLQPSPSNQQPLPQLDTAQQSDFNSQTTNQTTPPDQEFNNQYQNQNQYQNNQNSGRYVVYVDNGNRELLQQVHRVEPKAFLRQYQGRYVIQAGTFSKPDNAQRRLKDLADNGINGVRIGQEIPGGYSGGGYSGGGYSGGYSGGGYSGGYSGGGYSGGYYENNRSNYYYVVIPGRSQDLQIIEDKIRRNIGQGAVILQRNQPLGSHVAFGRFTQRADAEQWNSYLRKNLGFGNARVYYGK